MTSNDKQRARLIGLLKELFQLDQPDLDFGFYKIMHAKADQVSNFLETDLLQIIQDAFGKADAEKLAEAQSAYQAAKQKAVEYGAADPDATEPVKKAKTTLEAVRNAETHEGDVYDHLYRFFERYYDAGDFMSRRYFARETGGKAAPYAVPYDGREVYLHWANRDQYYIKTSEYLSNFAFDAAKSPDLPTALAKMMENKSLPVLCRVVAASEGEHSNVKSTEQTERFFVVHTAEPVLIEPNETGANQLVLQFEYKPLPGKKYSLSADREKELKSKYGARNKGDLPLLDMTDLYMAAIPAAASAYLDVFASPLPTDAVKNRTLLTKYLRQFTARNTMDYFIHKDLGGFLRRELDFYIKNEIIRLDEIDGADAPQVENYLARVKVLRQIARYLIEFLAQLEDFQKKLWLKKKFVTETHYCFSLDLIPENFHPMIATNKRQHDEWVDLFAINELEGYSIPLTPDFMKKNNRLLVDTALFAKGFKDDLIAEMQGLDLNLCGLMVNGDNEAGIHLITNKFQDLLSCIYIDPPYNTDASAIDYKNGYKSSSWTTMIETRMRASKKLLKESGVLMAAIDDAQFRELSFITEEVFGGLLGTFSVRSNPSGRPTKTGYSVSHEYMIAAGKTPRSFIRRMPPTEKQAARFNQVDSEGTFEWRNLRREGSNSDRTARSRLYYPIYLSDSNIRVPEMVWSETDDAWTIKEQPNKHEIIIFPDNDDGDQKTWRWEASTVMSSLNQLAIRKDRSGKDYVYYKRRPNDDGVVSVSTWADAKHSATEHGSNLVKAMFGSTPFSYPKSIHTVQDAIYIGGGSNSASIVLDYFAGSATTGHAVINLNREDVGVRKYILIEAESYFNTATMPRIKKAAYSSDWKEGKPVSRDGLSHSFKYLRLESYEDALNNLALRPTPDMSKAGAEFQRDYMLKYWLDFETKGSPSLLNIQTFDDPTDYRLNIKRPGTDEYNEQAIDLVETFNWLIGLHVEHLDRWRAFDAAVKRMPDPELPMDETTRLILDGKLAETEDGKWRFRKVEGYTLTTPGDDASREKTLVIWRVLTDDLEADNLMLDEWFKKYRLSTQDSEFDVIYVNGSNNLQNLRTDEETWKVRLLEETFHQAMWDVEG